MLISIDPGVNNCGISVLDITSTPEVKDVVLVKNARKFTEDEKVVEAKHGPRVVKVLAILAQLESLYAKYPEVDTIVVEAPFYNALTPSAFGSLLEVISAIRYNFVLKHDLQYKAIEPMLIKKMFTTKAMASKELIKQYLVAKIAEKSIIVHADPEKLSEHEIDAIAIGYTHHINLKTQIVLAAE